jgi:hypothetical protein
MIIYAHPHTFGLLAERPERFSGTRSGFCRRLFAAWLVFSGKADALSWEEWPPETKIAAPPPKE